MCVQEARMPSTEQWFDSKNAEQATAWNGAEGDRWTEDADRYDLACSRFDPILFDAARLAEDEAVLDVGCGCGISTRQAAREARRGSALGIDLSARMIECASERSRRDGLTNARFERGDAQIYRFAEAAFSAVLSRFGAMFFADPVAAFRNVGRALRPGGRLTMLAWKALAENEWVRIIRDSLAAGRRLPERPLGTPGPFGLADAATVQRVLDAAGFDRVELTTVQQPVIFGRTADDGFAYVRRMGMALALLEGLDESARESALANLARVLSERAAPTGVQAEGAAWLITARRA
jgi:SAM-dependent methyltransferase